MNYVYIGLIIVLFSISMYLGYRFYKSYTKEKVGKFIENKEYEKKEKIDGDFYFFYTTWCPHCKNSNKLWDEIRSNFKHSGMNINFIKVDCDKETEFADEYGITEYPSYVLVVKGKKYIYDAKLNEQTLGKFFMSVYDSV